MPQDKFPDPAGMVKTLKEELGFRVTLWIHPFINLECPSWMGAARPDSSFLVRDTKGKEGIGNLPGLVWWWQGVLAGYIDFSNPAAVDWWRVRPIQVFDTLLIPYDQFRMTGSPL